MQMAADAVLGAAASGRMRRAERGYVGAAGWASRGAP